MLKYNRSLIFSLVVKMLFIWFFLNACQAKKEEFHNNIKIKNQKKNHKNKQKGTNKNNLIKSYKNVEKKTNSKIMDSGNQNKIKDVTIQTRNSEENVESNISITWKQYKLIGEYENKEKQPPNLINKGLYINFYCNNCKNDNWIYLGRGYFNIPKTIYKGLKCNFCNLFCSKRLQNCDFKLLGMHNCSYRIEMEKFLDQNKLPYFDNLKYLEEKKTASKKNKFIVLNMLGRLSYFEIRVY